MKPKVLYHASPNNGIEILEPRAESTPENWKNGTVVFATHSLAFASGFLLPAKKLTCQGGNFGGVFFFISQNGDKCRVLDCGGTIYEVDSSSFTHHKGFEWYSKISVKPTNKIKVESALDYMMKQGVQVYFVDEDTYGKLASEKTHRTCKLLNSLISENEKLGLKVKRFDIHNRTK